MAVIVGTVLYKLTTLLVGLALAYLGYKLFVSGIFEGGGDLNATFVDGGLVLKKASPGIFFALFGTVVIAISLWKGQELENLKAAPPSQPVLRSTEDRIAIDTLKEIISGNQDASAISPFEVKAIEGLFAHIEGSGSEVATTSASRGIASEP